MKYFITFLACVFIQPVLAGITYEKPEKSLDTKNISTVADQVNKTFSPSELSGVNARLRVENAVFRPFNLYFAPVKMASVKNDVQKKLLQDVRDIVERDLKIVGGFNFISSTVGKDDDDLLKQKGAEGISRLTLSFQGLNAIHALLEHKNFVTKKQSVKSFLANPSSLRRLAHLLSQNIYETFIGPEDIFLLQIAAIKRDSFGNQVVLLDFDGQNETVITEGSLTKTAPYFSPDGKSILYTVITPQGQGIVEQTVGSKQFVFRVKKPGLNLDSRILPDNSGMLATLSYEGSANVYKISKSGTILGKVTHGLGLNLSPSVSFDGKELAFVSDRAGTPQIYVQSLAADGVSRPAQRLTFQGKYNQTPHFSPDAKLIAFTGRDEAKVFDIFIVERSSGNVSRVTENQGRNQEPHFSPSGRFIIFTSEREGKPKPDIFIASLNGSHQYRLTDVNADKKSSLGYFSPVIRPKQ